jgi:hypothetical protein
MCAVHGWDAPCKCGYAVSKRAAYAIGLASFLLGTACSGLLPAEVPDVDPCAAEIARLEGLRVLELRAACQGLSFDECLPTIDSVSVKYDGLIQEQVRCGADR